jgi:hypothetical protein
MGRKSFTTSSSTYDGTDIPSRIEGGGSAMPVLRGELL